MGGKPGARELPVALDGNFGDPQFLGDLAFRQSAEESQFGNAGGSRIRSFEFLQRFVDDQQIVVRARCSGIHHVKRNAGFATTSLFRAMRTRVIDQDAPERIRGDGEKMRAVVPLGRGAGMKPKIKLIDQGRWLQGVIGTFRAKHARGYSMQFRIQSFDDDTDRFAVVLVPSAQIFRDWRRRTQNEMILETAGIRLLR
jgi:hypothetical protein